MSRTARGAGPDSTVPEPEPRQRVEMGLGQESEVQPLKIVLTGFFGGPNAGDEAFLEALLAELGDARARTEITVVSTDPVHTSRHYDVTATPRSPLSYKMHRALAQADVVIAAGGGLLTDRTSVWHVPATVIPMAVAKLFGSKLVLLGIGATSLDTRLAKSMVAWVSKHASYISARDPSSLQVLKELWPVGDMTLGGDTATLLSCDGVELAPDVRSLFDKPGPRIGISLRHWFPQGRPRGLGYLLPVALQQRVRRRREPALDERVFWVALAEMCEHLVSSYGAALYFVPMWPGRDDVVARAFLDRYPGSFASHATVIDQPLEPREIIRLCGEFDAVIGMRLHSLIFASIARCPALALSYSAKVEAFMGMIGAADQCVDVYSADAPQLRAAFDRMWRERHQRAAQQHAGLVELRRRAQQGVCALFDLLNETSAAEAG